MKYPMIEQRTRMMRQRRGNALVLVAGVLVLLVIVASAYITSTQGIRRTAAAQQRSVNTSAAAEVLADDLAREVSQSLFVREIDTSNQFTNFGTINLAAAVLSPGGGTQNLSIRFMEDRRVPANAREYQQEAGRPQGRYEVDRNFSWNYAPYETVARTNWPDYYAPWHGYSELNVLGAGPGSAITFTAGINPPGQPGTSDTRWLRDLEPLRIASAYLPASMGLSFESNVDTFSHYGHLSNPAHSGNDWRICRDIADVTGVWSRPHDSLDESEIVDNPLVSAVEAPDGEFYFGGLLRDHHVPVEQWLPYNPQPLSVNIQTPHGGGIFEGPADFWSRWVRWFDYAGYAYAQQQMHEYIAGNQDCNPSLIPPNFYDLSNPDGSSGVMGIGGNEANELPRDEFVRGSSRWHIGRVLTDSDGDGFTDSFWFNVPGSGSEGTMQVVGVSVTDNGGRVNANAATQFIRSDDVNRYQTRTRGWTPADLALVGQDAGWDPDESYAGWEEAGSSTLEAVRGRPWTHETWNVGLLDAPVHSTGLFDSEFATGMPVFSSELVNYGQQGVDAVDVPSLSQEGEAHPIWERGQFRDRRDDNGVGDFVSALGIRDNLTFPELYTNDYWDGDPAIGTNRDIRRQINRLFYWQHAGSRPQDPAMGFTPFSVSDELELRMNEGNNQPWLLSRFERSLSTNAQHDSFNGGYYFRQLLRSASVREENGELSDQLSPRQLMHDTRRKLTLFNGARNEHLPPWLWWENRGNRLFAVAGLVHGRPLSPPVGLLGVVGSPGASTGRFDLLDEAWLGVSGNVGSFGDVRRSGALAQFYDQMRLKLDLREHERFVPAQGLGTSVTGYRPRTFSERLPMALFLALTSGDLSVHDYDGNGVDEHLLTPDRSSNLFDDPDGGNALDELTRTRELAASYAANMLAFRDPDSEAPLFTQTRTVGLPSDPAYTGVTEYGAVRPPILMEEQGEPTLVGPDLLPNEGNPDPHYLGMEMQPFILESFVAHVHKPWSVPDSYVTSAGGGGPGGQLKYYRWKTFRLQPKFVDHTPDYDTTASFDSNEAESRNLLKQQSSTDKIQKPDTIAVVQIANPYDRPLPLFGRDSTGAYNRNLPLYKVKLFGKEAVIDDDLDSVPESGNTGHLTTMRRTGYVNLDGNPDVLADSADRLPWFLPPATGDAPYTLTMFITSIEDKDEKAKWIDFLDIHPGDHFFTPGHDPYNLNENPTLHPSHPFLLSRDVDLDGAIDDPSYYMELKPGQLICEVTLDAGAGGWSDDRSTYDGSGSGNDVAVELIRIHRRDVADTALDPVTGYSVVPAAYAGGDGRTHYDYEYDVLIDRTGNTDEGDEFFETVRHRLPAERLPSLAELGQMKGAKELDTVQEAQSESNGSTFTRDPEGAKLRSRLRVGQDALGTEEYAAIITAMSAGGGFGGGTRVDEFRIDVPTFWDPTTSNNARWCQWARYTRAWGVDPEYPALDVAGYGLGGNVNTISSTAVVPAPVSRMDYNAPRYIIGQGQVTRSKGRLQMGGDSKTPLAPAAMTTDTVYAGMEQVEGDFAGLGNVEIKMLNPDPRSDTANNLAPRYMWQEGASGQVGNFATSWGHLFDVSTEPDGEYDTLMGTDPLVHWDHDKLPWMTRNYRLPAPIQSSSGFGGAYTKYFYANRKPTFFDMHSTATSGGDVPQGFSPWDAPAINYPHSSIPPNDYFPRLPDKGYYGYDGVAGAQPLAPYGLQMLQKDANYEQIGEVLNVWVWGHRLQLPEGQPGTHAISLLDGDEVRTFSEIMRGLAIANEPFDDVDDIAATSGAVNQGFPVNLFPYDHPKINRLSLDATQRNTDGVEMSTLNSGTYFAHDPIGWADPNGPVGNPVWLSDIGNAEPDQLAAQRVLDLFVCDGPGIWDLSNAIGNEFSDGIIDEQWQTAGLLGAANARPWDPVFGNAAGFEGKATPGLVNVNTATVEALRTLPHMYKMVHGTPDYDTSNPLAPDGYYGAGSEVGSIIESTGTSQNTLFDPHPRVAIPEAIVQYRNRQGQPPIQIGSKGYEYLLTGYKLGPGYQNRGAGGERGQRGLASLGELFNVNKDSYANFDYATVDQNDYPLVEPTGTEIPAQAWTMSYAAADPFTIRREPLMRFRAGSMDGSGPMASDMRVPDPSQVGYDSNNNGVFDWDLLPMGAPLSTDVNGEPLYGYYNSNGKFTIEPSALPDLSNQFLFDVEDVFRGGDKVAGDAEEMNMLFAGMSNMITTRSDMFTVHFRVRTFKQNPETGVWDATDRDQIVDDSRYVMLVDRSNVNTPDDAPRILYLQKVEN